KLRSERNMRWRDPQLSFTRPIRWLVALLGGQVLPVTAGALTAGRTTRLHRRSAEVPDASGYASLVDQAGIIVDEHARRRTVAATAQELARRAGGRVDLDAESALLDQITFLVEQPTAILGAFDASYLDLPEAVLTTVMRKHQRYLPVRGAD